MALSQSPREPTSSRGYRHEADFQAVMGYLRATYSETGSLHNWLPPRFENCAKGNEVDTRIWETQSGRIVALANPEEKLRYFIQVHPNYAFLEEEVIEWIEGHSAKRCAEQMLSIISLEGNPIRETTLRKHGFEKGEVYGILRLRNKDASIPKHRLPDGFRIRSVNPETDFEELAMAVRTVFSYGEWFNKDILVELSRASFYNKELDLVAVDRDNIIACFCTFRLDAPSGITELEPMGTLPRYQGLGLAKALLCEGFRRLKKFNPTLIYIGGAANRLYETTGFTDRHDYNFWNKMI